jgi:hypothetical protein
LQTIPRDFAALKAQVKELKQDNLELRRKGKILFDKCHTLRCESAKMKAVNSDMENRLRAMERRAGVPPVS